MRDRHWRFIAISSLMDYHFLQSSDPDSLFFRAWEGLRVGGIFSLEWKKHHIFDVIPLNQDRLVAYKRSKAQRRSKRLALRTRQVVRTYSGQHVVDMDTLYKVVVCFNISVDFENQRRKKLEEDDSSSAE